MGELSGKSSQKTCVLLLLRRVSNYVEKGGETALRSLFGEHLDDWEDLVHIFSKLTIFHREYHPDIGESVLMVGRLIDRRRRREARESGGGDGHPK